MKTVSRSSVLLGTGAICVVMGILLFQLFDFSPVPAPVSGDPAKAQGFLQQAVRAISEVALRNAQSDAWSASFFRFDPQIPEIGDVVVFSNGTPQWRGLNSDFSGWSANVSLEESSRWQRLPSDYSKRIATVSAGKRSFLFEKTSDSKARVLSIALKVATNAGERVVLGHVDAAAFPLMDTYERQQIMHDYQSKQIHWWSDPNVAVKIPTDSDLGLVALKDYDLWYRSSSVTASQVDWEKKIRAGLLLVLLIAGIALGGRRKKRKLPSAPIQVAAVQWTVQNGSQTLGPVDAAAIAQMLFAQEIDFDSMVRRVSEKGHEQQEEEPLSQSTVFSELPIEASGERIFWVYAPDSTALKARIEGPFTAEALKQAWSRGWVPQDAWVCARSTLTGWRPISTWIEEANSVPEVLAA